MKTIHKTLSGLCIAAALAGGGYVIAAGSPPSISDARLNAVIKAVEQSGRSVTPEQREMIRKQLVQTEVLKDEALAQGLDKDPQFQITMENLRSDMLAKQLVFDYARKHPATSAEIKQAYQQTIASQPAQKSYLVQHILYKTKAEADTAIELLRKGKAFDQLARTQSADEGSRDSGGSLGWISPESLDPKFAEAMVKLSKGQVTAEPVQSQFGWHVIKLDNVRDENRPTLEEAKPQLEQFVMQQKIEQYVTSLLNKAGVAK